jgi:hypothetical protein
MPQSRARLQAAIDGLVEASSATGRELNDEWALRLIRVFFGPSVIVGQLTPEQREKVSGFLERLADELLLVEIEESLRSSDRPRTVRGLRRG